MRCAMADETLHLYNLDDDEESDEFEYDRSNDIDAQTAAVVKAPMRESAVSSPIETVTTAATVCAQILVDVKITNTGDL